MAKYQYVFISTMEDYRQSLGYFVAIDLMTSTRCTALLVLVQEEGKNSFEWTEARYGFITSCHCTARFVADELHTTAGLPTPLAMA
jgi:hypothetical protein